MSQASPSNSLTDDIEGILCELMAVEDLAVLTLFCQLLRIAHLLGHITVLHDDIQLSPPRAFLLAQLAASVQAGNREGLSPSDLSILLSVSRNTVSSLINGLEDQGLVWRQLHPTDRRRFLIQITPHGYAVVREQAPHFARRISSILGVLSLDERNQLSILLQKLHDGLAAHVSV